MKKLLCLFFCLTLLCGCARTYDGPTDTVEMLSEYVTVHRSSITGNSWKARTTFAYDIYGNLASHREYRDDELDTVTNYRYDDNGNEKTQTRWDHSGLIPHIDSRTDTTYDDQGRVLTVIHKNMWGAEESRVTYTYDDENYIKTHTYSGDGLVTTYYCNENWETLRATNTMGMEDIFTYDENGYLIRTESFQNGVSMGYSVYENDDQGRAIHWANYDENGALYSESTCVYDDEARTMTQTKSDGGIRITYYTPDGRTNLIEDYNKDGDLQLYQQYTFREIRVPAN